MNSVVNFQSNTTFVEIEIGGKVQLGVNARDLHKMLEVKADFSHWIKKRISQCKFEENFDYIKLVKKNELSKTGQWVTEYVISVDMTKHLGMMEKNDKGHQIRKYYIEQERLARDAVYGIQLEINKAMLQLDHVKDVLSNAGRTLCVIGKQVKPQLMQNLDALVAKAQPQLPFNGDDKVA